MSAIFFLIGCSITLALIFLGAFFWANRSGQHEDTYTPAVRILFDDELRGDVSHDGKASSVNSQPIPEKDEIASDLHPDKAPDVQQIPAK